MNNYYPGNEITITGTIRTAAGTLYDPDTVIFNATDPQDTDYTYTYGTDDEITKTSTGVYAIALFIPFTNAVVGVWAYGLQGINSDEQSVAYQAGNFKVLESKAI